MIPLQEAKQLVLQQAHSFGKENIELTEASGRVLSQIVIADRDYPPFNRATMDGIAINFSDWKIGIRSFKVIETIYAGKQSELSLISGTCYKIMTGASVPLSADAVIRKEDLEKDKDKTRITANEVIQFQNIAPKGSDVEKETAIIKSNQLIKPGVVTTLASLGYSRLDVEKLPAVSIITTGDEVKDIQYTLNEVQIRNSNKYLLTSLLQQWKIKPVSIQHLNDNASELLNAIDSQKQNDILILSGAVSAGDADYVPEVLTKAGAKNIFHKVAIRPGKPIWFGQFENGATVFALPGNPFSTFVTFKLFIETFLLACFGLPDKRILQLPFNGNRIKKTNLDEFFPVTISGSPSSATSLSFNTSGDITAVLQADALAMHPAAIPELIKTDIVSCIIL